MYFRTETISRVLCREVCYTVSLFGRVHYRRFHYTYYQIEGWFMYMRYTQGQNEEYLLSRSMY